MRPKIPVPPCRFCKKKFQRNEHLMRHERTRLICPSPGNSCRHKARRLTECLADTNEKPFHCKCGQAFSRRDLLSRHTKQAHPDGLGALPTDDVIQSTQPSDEVPNAALGHTAQAHMSTPPNPTPYAGPRDGSSNHLQPTAAFGPPPSYTEASSLDIDMIQQPTNPAPAPSTVSAMHPETNEYLQMQTLDPSLQNHPVTQAPGVDNTNSELWGRGFGPSFGEDLDLLWNDFDLNNSLLFPSTIASGFPMNLVSTSHSDIDELGLGGLDGLHDPVARPSEFAHSRFASRLPSVASGDEETAEPDAVDIGDTEGRRHVQRSLQDVAASCPRAPWRLTRQDYDLITTALNDMASVLGPQFEMPSRHALCRYIEGYFSGFHEHLPFIHRHAIDIPTEAPELILAILAVGARYRFQRKQCHSLYLSALAAVDHQLSQRDGNATPPSLHNTPGFLSDGCSTVKVPEPAPDQPSLTPMSSPLPISADILYRQKIRDVKTMQAMVLLIALGTWNHGSLLQNAFSMASRLALMVREDSATGFDTTSADLSWQDWVYVEGRRRTKIVAYSFTNLLSITYNISPGILNREIGLLKSPSPESHWRAGNTEEWQAARREDPHVERQICDEFASLFEEGSDGTSQRHGRPSSSSFGNYVLIHCILQQIFFVRCSTFDDTSATTSLPAVVSLRLERALKAWQKRWEATKDSSLDPSAPGGPLSFNSTALFRLAYIRIHADFGPSRQLDRRDPYTIVQVYRNAPLLARTSGVRRAALQCAHSLSIPVRIGIEFVARTQTLTWSIVHSIAHLECALFLCGWLETMADVFRRGAPLEDGERRLLGIVMSILSETDFAASIQQEGNDVQRIKRMCAAIFQLWALTYKGAHVFDIMGTIGEGLDLCSKELQKDIGT